jgi:hypothetical protein
MSVTRDEMVSLESAFGLKLDIDAKISSLLLQELSQSFHKEIFKEMIACSEEFLDVMNLSESDGMIILHNYLRENNFDFIICSSQLGMFAGGFQYQVVNDTTHALTRLVLFINWVRLGGIPVYIDAYKKWGDKEIICGRSGSFNYNYKVDEPDY